MADGNGAVDRVARDRIAQVEGKVDVQSALFEQHQRTCDERAQRTYAEIQSVKGMVGKVHERLDTLVSTKRSDEQRAFDDQHRITVRVLWGGITVLLLIIAYLVTSGPPWPTT